MSKLDWSKANRHEPDPARFQRANDFVEPDNIVVSVSDLTAEDRKLLRQYDSRGGKVRAKLKPASKRKPKPKRRKKQPTEEERLRAAEERRIAEAHHQERYLAKARRQLAEMAAKKKSHLSAWLEKRGRLPDDRKSLNETWRSKLLGRPKKD